MPRSSPASASKRAKGTPLITSFFKKKTPSPGSKGSSTGRMPLAHVQRSGKAGAVGVASKKAKSLTTRKSAPAAAPLPPSAATKASVKAAAKATASVITASSVTKKAPLSPPKVGTPVAAVEAAVVHKPAAVALASPVAGTPPSPQAALVAQAAAEPMDTTVVEDLSPVAVKETDRKVDTDETMEDAAPTESPAVVEAPSLLLLQPPAVAAPGAVTRKATDTDLNETDAVMEEAAAALVKPVAAAADDEAERASFRPAAVAAASVTLKLKAADTDRDDTDDTVMKDAAAAPDEPAAGAETAPEEPDAAAEAAPQPPAVAASLPLPIITENMTLSAIAALPANATLVELPSAPVIPYQPVAGGRCRVFFEKGTDYFHRTPTERHSGWYPATIVKVTKHRGKADKWTLQVTTKFDDRTTGQYTYPNDSLQLMANGMDAVTKTPCMFTAQGNVFYFEQPDKLDIGDLVFGYCQDGLHDGAWFRGRVAAVGTVEMKELPFSSIRDAAKAVKGGGYEFKVCSIGYDDSEWEEKVPYGTGIDKVKLIERGWDKPEWLQGLTVSIPSRRLKIPQGVVVRTAPGQPVTLEYEGPMGKFTENKTYKQVALKAFEFRKPDASKILAFPIIGQKFTFATAAATVGDRKQSKPVARKTATRKSKAPRAKSQATREQLDSDSEDSLQPSPTKRPRRQSRAAKKVKAEGVASPPSSPKEARTTRPRRAVAAKMPRPEADVDDLDIYMSDTPVSPPAKKKGARKAAVAKKEPKSKASRVPAKDRKPRASRKAAAVEEGEDVTPLPEEPQYFSESSDDEVDESLVGVVTELGFSACNTYGRALNSSDTHLGAARLIHTVKFNKQVPNVQLCQTLVDLMTYGPKSQDVTFPDCRRMALATEYIDLLFTMPGFADKLCESTQESYWEECLDQATALVYTAEGDEMRTSSFAMERLGQSLHVKVSCMSLFLRLLKHQLKALVLQKGEVDMDDLRSKPIVKEILAHRRGPKEALEKALTAWSHLEIVCNRFDMFGYPAAEPEEEENPSSEATLSFAHMQARALLELMANVCSYLAWLYGVEAHEDTNAIARIMTTTFCRELENTSFDSSKFIDHEIMSKAEYDETLKFSFMYSLNKRCVAEIRPAVARLFGAGVTKEWNIMAS